MTLRDTVKTKISPSAWNDLYRSCEKYDTIIKNKGDEFVVLKKQNDRQITFNYQKERAFGGFAAIIAIGLVAAIKIYWYK